MRQEKRRDTKKNYEERIVGKAVGKQRLHKENVAWDRNYVEDDGGEGTEMNVSLRCNQKE